MGSARAASRSHERTPAGRRGARMESRASRALATGRRRAARRRAGRAADRSTEKTVRPPSGSTESASGPAAPASRERGSTIRSTPFSQATTTRPPWRSSWARSSSAGARGLCSATIAPRRSAP